MTFKKFYTTVIGMGLMLSLVLMPCAISHAASKKPINLTISTWAGPKHYMSVGYWKAFFIPQLEKLSKGRVKCTLYTGGALGKPAEHYDMAVKDIADITWGLLGYTPGRFPLAEVVSLPFIATEDGVVNSMVLWQLYEEFPQLRKSFEDTHPILFYCLPPDGFHTAKDLFHSLNDFKGKKIREPTGTYTDLIRSFGASPVQMPITELYQAARTGVIDAWISSMTTLKAFKMAEVVRASYLPGWCSSAFFVTMNKKKWNSLPKDIQQIIMQKLGGRAGAEWCGDLGNKAQQEGIEYTKKLGNPVYTWSPKMMSQFKKAAKPIHQKWIAEKAAKGLPARAVYDRAVELFSAYSQ